MSYCPYYLPDLKTQSHLSGQNLFSHTDRDGHEYIKMYIKKTKKDTVWNLKDKYKIQYGKIYLNTNTKYCVGKCI